MQRRIFIGWDPREAAAFAVARYSLRRHMAPMLPVNGLILDDLRRRGLYTRPTEVRNGPAGSPVLWDVISDAPMSTQHANARFLVRELSGCRGWSLFMDGDMLVRDNVAGLFDQLDPSKALYCVRHEYEIGEAIKMDGQKQTSYSRKNWSSFFIINNEHEANKALTVELINTVPGRDLHRFCWLDDDGLIGELAPEWNYLIGVSTYRQHPKVCHFTLGTPDVPGYEQCDYSFDWHQELRRWAA